ncbi:MAG: hypothetical protein J5J06_06310 [Phycisphaerae bacterium]|nr:hypothetical protein [Phycisphaerae bacterium]
MLRNLRAITTWTWNLETVDFAEQVKLTSDPDVCAPCVFPHLEAGRAKALRARVLANTNTSAPLLLAAGRELLLDDEVFSRLHGDERWPKNFTWNPKTGRSEDRVEKAEPHCAAIVTSAPTEAGTLSVHEAVFLPLSKGRFDDTSCGGSLHFRLILHGQFFLDAGRRELYEAGNSGDSLQETWNRHLLNNGVTTLVLAALADFAGTDGVSPDDIWNLTDALQRSQFFAEHRRSICRDQNWVRRLTFGDDDWAGWQLADPACGLLVIPTVGSTPDVAIETFPSLPTMSERLVLVEDQSPRLSREDPSQWRIRNVELEQLLSSMPVAAFTGPNTLAYLTEFLGLEIGPLPDAARQTLVSKASEAIAHKGIGAFRELGVPLKRLLRHLGEEAWVRFGPVDKESAAVYRDLNRLGLRHIVLPGELTPDDLAGDSFALDELERILSWLAGSAANRPVLRTSALAFRAIEAASGSLEEKLAAVGDYRVLLVRDGTDHDPEQLVSLRDLNEMLESDRLFGGSSALLRALQRCLKETRVYSLVAPRDSQPFSILFGLAHERNCNVDACVQLLDRHKPTLAEPKHRVELLERIAPNGTESPSPERLRAVRFLLHGDSNHGDDVGTALMVRSNVKHAEPIAKLARAALQHRESEWRWIADSLGRRLNADQQDTLGLSPVDVDVLEALLRETGTDWLHDVEFSADESRIFLQEIRDPILWRKLPFHQTVDGRFVSIEASGVYMQSSADTPIPTELSRAVTIIERPTSRTLLEKYERNGVQYWGDVATIEIALEQRRPDEYAETILDAISRQCQADGKIPVDLLRRIRETKWLPTQSESAVTPAEVILLPQLEEELQRLLADPDVGHAFACALHLTPPVREHPAFGMLRQRGVFPGRRESLHLLAVCLGASSKYRVGRLEGIETNAAGFGSLLSAFDGVATDVLPALTFLRPFRREFEDELDSIAETVLPELRGQLSTDTIIGCLRAISERHIVETRRRGGARLVVFRAYLSLLLSHPDYDPALLESVSLLNRAGEWRQPAILCARAEGIDDEWLLLEEWADLFHDDERARPLADAVVHEEEEAVESAGTEALLTYARRWEGYVDRRLMGGLLGFFGDEPAVIQRASELLHPRTLKNSRDEVEWPLFEHSKMIGNNENVHKVMAKQRFSVSLTKDDSVRRIPNLVGGWFDARVGGPIHTVFAGSLWPTSRGVPPQPGYRVKAIALREFDPGKLTPQRRREVLFESLRTLLDEVYNRRPTNLRAVWESLAESNQLELEVIQDHLLKNAWFYFQQLGNRKLKTLEALLREHDELSFQESELHHSSAPRAPDELQRVQHALASLPSRLKDLLEADEEVQKDTLGAVRAKMADFEYSERSIPFELFQNADDASSELAKMLRASTPDISQRAVLICTDETLVFVHWGRPINEFSRGDFPAERGRNSGYDRDLWKMLILSASEKSERAEFVTGRFGLGFKAVFFATDCPRILSANLGFKVVGGFFPRRLPESERENLRSYTHAYDGHGMESTVVELPLLPGKATMVSAAVQAFSECLPITLAFSHRIRECRIVLGDGVDDWYRIQEQPVTGCAGVYAACVTTEGPGSGYAERRALVFRAENGGALFIDLEPLGVRALEGSVPSFWVTVPTQTHFGAGVAVHGPFDLDVGRSQLAQSERNVVLSRTLGVSVGRQLVELFDAAEDWPSAREQLGLAADATAQGFWSSLWEVLTRRSILRNDLLRESLWRANCGIHRLATERRAVPTSLGSAYNSLTSIRDIRAEVVGILDADQQLFSKVTPWASFNRKWRPRELVSSSRCWRVFREATETPAEIATASLMSVLDDELNNVEVDPESAGLVGAVVSQSAMEKWRNTAEYTDEVEEIATLLADLRFRTAGGGCAYAKTLVTRQAGGDEARRAAFAPKECTLSPDYGGAGVEFFLAARSKLHAPPVELAKWILTAETDASRQAGLRYLLDGDLAQQVAQQLRDLREGTWLEGLTPDELQAFGFPEAEQDRLLVTVGTERGELVRLLGDGAGMAGVAGIAPPTNPTSVLRAIHDWWQAAGNGELEKYEARLYPDGVFPLQTTETDTLDRIGWLSMFLVACTQTSGRIQDTQSREFLRLCQRRGWLENLGRAETEPGEWVRSWIEYVSNQTDRIKYLHWAKQLVSLSVIAHWLTEYVEALRAIDAFSQDFRLDEIMNPRSSAAFSGGGPDAPPLEPLLGIGQCLLVRELVRHGMVRNPLSHRWCFVPQQRTRNLVARLGGPNWSPHDGRKWEFSADIFGFLSQHLDDATFNSAFDIPLMIVAERDDLWEQFLDEARPDDDSWEET